MNNQQDSIIIPHNILDEYMETNYDIRKPIEFSEQNFWLYTQYYLFAQHWINALYNPNNDVCWISMTRLEDQSIYAKDEFIDRIRRDEKFNQAIQGASAYMKTLILNKHKAIKFYDALKDYYRTTGEYKSINYEQFIKDLTTKGEQKDMKKKATITKPQQLENDWDTATWSPESNVKPEPEASNLAMKLKQVKEPIAKATKEDKNKFELWITVEDMISRINRLSNTYCVIPKKYHVFNYIKNRTAELATEISKGDLSVCIKTKEYITHEFKREYEIDVHNPLSDFAHVRIGFDLVSAYYEYMNSNTDKYLSKSLIITDSQNNLLDVIAKILAKELSDLILVLLFSEPDNIVITPDMIRNKNTEAVRNVIDKELKKIRLLKSMVKLIEENKDDLK